MLNIDKLENADKRERLLFLMHVLPNMSMQICKYVYTPLSVHLTSYLCDLLKNSTPVVNVKILA